MKRGFGFLIFLVVVSLVGVVSAECVDSDGGFDISVKGTAEGNNNPSFGPFEGLLPAEDKCIEIMSDGGSTEVFECSGDNCAIEETICKNFGETENIGPVTYSPNGKGIPCQDGCIDGACICIESKQDLFDTGGNIYNNGNAQSFITEQIPTRIEFYLEAIGPADLRTDISVSVWSDEGGTPNEDLPILVKTLLKSDFKENIVGWYGVSVEGLSTGEKYYVSLEGKGYNWFYSFENDSYTDGESWLYLGVQISNLTSNETSDSLLAEKDFRGGDYTFKVFHDCNDRLVIPSEGTGPIKIIEKESSKNGDESSVFCTGCELDDKCYPFGYRKSGNYCSESGEFISQKEEGSCDNSFECRSNFCVDDECSSPGFFKKIIDWFRNLFGKEE